MTFLADANVVGTAALVNGQASLTTNALATGAHSITAQYSGSSTFSPSTSATASFTVAQAPSTTTITATPNPSAVGQAVTFTVTVSGPSTVGPPIGTVTLLDGILALGTATLSGGTARFTTSMLTAGVHSITASYGGDTNFLTGISPVLSQQVRQAQADPTVTNLQRFGFHDQPTMMVLSFSAPLDPRRAEDVANYTVAGAGGSQTYTVTAAVYNSADNTVTLNFRQRLNVHHTFTIRVNGTAPDGLTSASGVLLDGAHTGQPGSNYTDTFGMETLAGTASEAALAPTMLKLEQIDHGHITARAIAELVAQGELKARRHHHSNL